MTSFYEEAKKKAKARADQAAAAAKARAQLRKKTVNRLWERIAYARREADTRVRKVQRKYQAKLESLQKDRRKLRQETLMLKKFLREAGDRLNAITREVLLKGKWPQFRNNRVKL